MLIPMASQKPLDKYPVGVYSKVTPTKYPMGVYKNIGRVLCVWNIMNSLSVPTVRGSKKASPKSLAQN